MPMISVILCTHNPRREYLDRTLAGLRRQTRPAEELLIIDNASSPPLTGTIDLSWHPGARIIPESALGLTRARLRGIAEARGEVLVFVDDDNELDPDYLDRVAAIADRCPQVGAWGGSALPEYEVPPPTDAREMLPGLALRTVEKEVWSNFSWDSLPYGTGLCVRRGVATRYSETVRSNPERMGLGRSGNSMMASEDVDLSMTAWDMGLATGLFPELRLLHLIPARRLELSYLSKICAGAAYSNRLLEYMRSGIPPVVPVQGWISRWKTALWWAVKSPRSHRLRHEAVQSGLRAADLEIARREHLKRQSA